MNQNTLAKRYAKALFESAQDHGLDSKVAKDLDSVKSLVDQSGEKKSLFISDRVPFEVKNSLWQELIISDSLDKLTVSFINLLLKENRIYLLDLIYQAFYAYNRKALGIRLAKVKSAIELSEQEKSGLVKELEQTLNSKIELSVEVDQSVIGGMLIQIDSMMYDATVANKLKTLKNLLIA